MYISKHEVTTLLKCNDVFYGFFFFFFFCFFFFCFFFLISLYSLTTSYVY